MNFDMAAEIAKRKGQYDTLRQKPVTDQVDFSEIMLGVSDGVKLRTMIWRPRIPGALPVILQRSCYPHSEEILKIDGQELARRGFCFILQWCRGTGGSEGEWVPNDYERRDGLDTLQWLEEQSFAGAVGYWGNSYLAYTGWCMADAVPAKVKSMYLGVYGTDRYTSAYQDGLFRQDILTAWAMGNAGKEIQADYLESCKYRPHINVDEALWGIRLPWYRDWIKNTDRNDAYWQQGLWQQLKEIPGKIKIPVFIREGWYDHHLGSALVSYQDLAVKSVSRLQIGPWNHGFQCAVEEKNIDLPDDSVQSPLDWFEQTLVKKEIPHGEVTRYVVGGGRWKRTKSLQETGKNRLRFYLSQAQEGRKLTVDRQTQEAVCSYTYDPANPVPSFGAESLFATVEAVGSKIQPPPDYRADVRSFVSLPLDQPIVIDGCMSVQLSVSSDAADTAFTAKIMEVLPDGRAINIRGGIATLAYRGKSGTRGTYTPGEIVDVTISLWDIAWQTEPGSCIRLDISSSDFPQYAVHSNYSGIWSEITNTKIAKQQIWLGGSHNTWLEIPCE